MTGDDADEVHIRSFERVFRQDRRIHQIEGHQLPIPIRIDAVIWGFVGLALSLLISRLPVIGHAYAVIPFFVRWIAIPAAFGYIATTTETQGRPVHLFAGSWLLTQWRHRRGGRSLGRRVPATEAVTHIDWAVWVSRDRNCPYLRRAIITGPAQIVFRDRVWAKAGTHDVVTVLGVDPAARPLPQRLRQAPKGFRATRRIELPADTTMRVMPL